ncbi:MAG: hypothetical protein ACQEP3_00085 [Patescibacteria group bacterium]
MTKNCWINGQGQVVFSRKSGESTKKVVLETIEDAISQNYHILDSLFIEFLENYEVTQVQFGEISVMRDILDNIQENITEMAGGIDPEKVNLSYLVKDLKNSRNRHKVRIYSLLEGDSQTMNELAIAHKSVVKRIEQLQGIIKGTLIQTRNLLEIRDDCEEKITYAHYVLATYELNLRKAKTVSGSEKEKIISKAVRDIAGKGANKVIFALDAATPVNPYKERIESREIKKLLELESYFEDWKRGEVSFRDIIRLISHARGKLKRIVRKNNDFQGIKKFTGGDLIG